MSNTATSSADQGEGKGLTMINRLQVLNVIFKWIDLLAQPVLALVFRVWVAKVFFMSGLTKIKSWDSTVFLFEYEYAVPVINHKVAAFLATGAELILPVLLAIGLAGRFSALGLFVVNIVAVISYPDISPAGINDHYFWGAMLITIFAFGPGKASLDHFIKAKVS